MSVDEYVCMYVVVGLVAIYRGIYPQIIASNNCKRQHCQYEIHRGSVTSLKVLKQLNIAPERERKLKYRILRALVRLHIVMSCYGRNQTFGTYVASIQKRT